MKIVLFMMFYAVFYAANVFSSSLSPMSAKEVFEHDWAGLHTGVILGAQWGRSNDKTPAFGYNADNDIWSYNASGFHVGAELGYSYPWRQLVIGPEIELGYLGIGGSGAQPFSPGFDTIGKSNSDFYTALRARVGVDLEHQSLLFVSAGAIGVNYTQRIVDSCNIAPCGGGLVDARNNSFVWGYTVGGGVEHLFEDGWSAKLECLYFYLNNQSLSGTTNLGNTYVWAGQTFGYIIRGGFDYHFFQ